MPHGRPGASSPAFLPVAAEPPSLPEATGVPPPAAGFIARPAAVPAGRAVPDDPEALEFYDAFARDIYDQLIREGNPKAEAYRVMAQEKAREAMMKDPDRFRDRMGRRRDAERRAIRAFDELNRAVPQMDPRGEDVLPGIREDELGPLADHYKDPSMCDDFADGLISTLNRYFARSDFRSLYRQLARCRIGRLKEFYKKLDGDKAHGRIIDWVLIMYYVFQTPRLQENYPRIRIDYERDKKPASEHVYHLFYVIDTRRREYIGAITEVGWYNPHTERQATTADLPLVTTRERIKSQTVGNISAKLAANPPGPTGIAISLAADISSRFDDLRAQRAAGVDFPALRAAAMAASEQFNALRIKLPPMRAGRRKTRRHGAGKKAETRHSPLARKLMVHRAYENVTIPTLKKEFAAAQVLDADLARKVNEARTPESREALREIQVQHAKQVLEGVKSTTAAADAAKSALRKEFNAKGGTRRRLRGGQDKFSPLAKRLLTSRTLEKGITPEMREKAEYANQKIAGLTALAEASRSPQVKTGILSVREQLVRKLHPEARESVAVANKAKAQLAREFNSMGGSRRRKRRHG